MTKAAMSRFLKEFPSALVEGDGAIFIGAGVSMAAGYPSWAALLHEIGEELGVQSRDVSDLAALAQWSIQESGGATRVRGVIKDNVAVDHPIPESLEIVARLPVKHIWTTNYDRLVERAFNAVDRPIDSVAGAKDLALKVRAGATRLYKMHGSVDRLDEVVISTDDYELFRSKRGSFLPLLQAHLTSMSMLFIGLSFTDPNVKHVLSLIRESFTDAPPEHFAIVRPPIRSEFKSEEEFRARHKQHDLWAKDLRRYGLVAVEIDDYQEVPALLRQVERQVAARRVWISGSWPIDADGQEMSKVYALAERVGFEIGRAGLDLITGTGLIVGAAATSGFLDALRSSGVWDLERRLIARPFPQPMSGNSSNPEHWTALRKEMARQAGIAIFLGGAKSEDGKTVPANGVIEEFSLVKSTGTFLLPVGSTGGAAEVIFRDLLESSLPSSGADAVRPTDSELHQLADRSMSSDKLIALIFDILKRVGNPL